ncbi:IclR family transcriptional regulator domain-containing protein, partial [Streptomyces lancefieldiae]
MGGRLGSTTTAAGLMLLAHAPAAVQEEALARTVPRHTPFTLTVSGRLRAVLAQARTCGYAVSDRQLSTDTLSVAAPVTTDDGEVTAAVSAVVRHGSTSVGALADLVRSCGRAAGPPGALRLDPRRLDDVSGITADSFTTAAHVAVYTAISTLPQPDPAEHAKNTKWLDRVLATSREQARGLTATYLHTLVQVCPWPHHAPAYARMVEAEHARRRLLTAAERLVHTVHDASLPLPVQTVLAEADALAAVVDDIANRFPPRSGVLPRT